MTGELRVSVIVPSHNHAAFVAEAIGSVLSQSYPPFEVLVVDDGSEDGSQSIIAGIHDERIDAVFRRVNLGAPATLNECLDRARGDLIAICNSDDAWEPDKLRRQVDFLSANPDIGVVFTDARMIDESGEPNPAIAPWMHNLFTVDNRSRWAWLRRLVEKGNSLCHPSILARREVYEHTGRYDNRLRQLPDFDMWLRILQRHAIHVLPEKLVRFRWLASGANTSARRPDNSARERNEFAFIVERFFSEIDADDFLRAFGYVRRPDTAGWNLAVEKILYLWSVEGSAKAIHRNIANHIALDLLGTRAGGGALEEYGFTLHDVHRLSGMSSPWVDRETREPLAAEEKALLRRIVATRTAGQP